MSWTQWTILHNNQFPGQSVIVSNLLPALEGKKEAQKMGVINILSVLIGCTFTKTRHTDTTHGPNKLQKKNYYTRV